ncbi:DUF3299 domain-containing protein [Pseudothioclava arenosa]|uniref:DUF3299 domain-containing protein n=1 Tax=Pseudothioclava arenosa TaxID=1795308 RepID=A0A2A4CI04_9RHOB|nr:DUF3299 domain-containing protein [Pseudothioclava arenosa]PCD75703.1 hypothetical protein CLN94_12365 [Pseudothioclava arenosa]
MIAFRQREVSVRFLISVFVAALLAATQATAEPEAIEFSDLADPLAVAFDDPYAAMGVDMMNELKLLVQSDEKLAGTDLDAETRTRLEARRTAAREVLETNGHDVEALLEQRWDVARKRQIARMATNPIFDGVEVSISGYIIPAPPDADGSGFGYLVPQVGMCSHLPPPPPNQLVRVRLRADQQVESLYLPVRVSGLLRVEPSDETIFILDGESRMLSGWTLNAETVELPEG